MGDNAGAAVLALARHHGARIGPEAYPLVLERLPLKDDEDEAKKVHKQLLELFCKEDALLVGNQANIPKILKVLAEVYKTENICEKETDEAIVATFKKLPAAMWQTYGSQFTEKQMKKIERILAA